MSDTGAIVGVIIGLMLSFVSGVLVTLGALYELGKVEIKGSDASQG